jgi:hypothetical protein
MLCFGFAIIDTLFLKIFIYYNYIIIVHNKFINFFLHSVVVWTINNQMKNLKKYPRY